MAISDEIELFLRNALREKALEDRLVKRALKDLRSTLGAIEQLVASSGALSLGINRERTIAAISSAVARNVQQTWGIPQLASLQQALEPFIEAQLEFGRKMVEAAGGTLATPGAASLNVAQTVNDAVVGGKTLSTQLTQTFPALVADRVERYVRLGLNQASGEVLETIAYQDAVVAVTERNVEALIRTGVHEVGSAAQMAIYEFEADPDWLEGKLTWTAVLDSAACPICIGLDGKDYELGTPGPYFDGRNKISPHPNCVLGSTRVQPGTIAAGMRTTYSGNIVTISTSNGRDLAVTENHPVLTANGWKPAKLVTEGDQLLSQRIPDGVTSIDPDFNQSPSTAEELFTLVLQQSTVKRCGVPATSMDFHGDGTGMHGNVEIACVNRELLLHGEALCPEHIGQALLVGADVDLAPVTGLSPLDSLLLAMHATASSLVGGSDLAAALLRGELTPLQSLRLALIARRHPRFDEPLADAASGNTQMLSDLVFAHTRKVELGNHLSIGVGLGPDADAMAQQAITDGFNAHTMPLGQLVHAHPGLVELDNVVSVQIEARHDVPVYDFTTLSGAYFADGILTHNCRCYVVPAKWRDDDMTSPSGDAISARRPAEGDKGESTVTFKKAAKTWVKENPETARQIFGKRLGDQLVAGTISFDKAVKQWSGNR